MQTALKGVPTSERTPMTVPTVFPAAPQPVSRLPRPLPGGLPGESAPLPLTGHAVLHPATALAAALDHLTMGLAALGLARADLDEIAPEEARGVGSAYRFATSAARRVHGLLEAQIATAWEAFDYRRRRGLPMVTERQRLAHGLLTAHMRPRRAWRKAGEWAADGGLYTKVRGVVKTDGAQTNLKAFRSWAGAHADRGGALSRIALRLVVNDPAGGGVEVRAVDLDGTEVSLGWLNPKYVPALRPLVAANRVTATVRGIPQAPDYDVLGCVIRLQITDLVDPLAQVEIGRLRDAAESAAESPGEAPPVAVVPAAAQPVTEAEFARAVQAANELF